MAASNGSSRQASWRRQQAQQHAAAASRGSNASAHPRCLLMSRPSLVAGLPLSSALSCLRSFSLNTRSCISRAVSRQTFLATSTAALS